MRVIFIENNIFFSFLQTSDSSSYSWWVPLTFSYPEQGFNKTYSKTWLKKGEQSRLVSGLPESLTPVIFNVQETGYYRWGPAAPSER